MPAKLKWSRHEDLAIERRPSIGRKEYLDHMTFRSNQRPLFTEIFGPLIGPKQVRAFILPYYRRIWDMLRDRGTRLFDQDSDGDMNPLIDVFLEAGINCMHPMQPAANTG